MRKVGGIARRFVHEAQGWIARAWRRHRDEIERWRRHRALVVAVVVASVVIAVIAGTRASRVDRTLERSRSAAQSRQTAAAPSSAMEVAIEQRGEPKHAPSRVSDIQTLLDRGERERAMALLREMRSADPSDTNYAAMFARVAFEQRRWAEALAAFRTIMRAEARRADPVLINGVIDSLQNETSSRAAEQILRELGTKAEPYLTNAATEHPIPRVRGRVRRLLGHDISVAATRR